MAVDTLDSTLVVIPEGRGLDSYLVYVAPEGKPFAGKYRFPGGKLQEGEEYSDTLFRELLEEYGVTILGIRLLYMKENILGGDLYLCNGQIHGIPTREEPDVGEPEWLSARELFQSSLVPNCKIALYVHLHRENSGTLDELLPDIMGDQEFVDHLQSEATDLYQDLMARS